MRAEELVAGEAYDYTSPRLNGLPLTSDMENVMFTGEIVNKWVVVKRGKNKLLVEPRYLSRRV